METDPTTGLPKLPEGHFWRVERTNPGWRMCLMRTMHFQFRGRVEHCIDDSGAYPLDALDKHALLTTASTIWHRHFGGQLGLIGDYPPKTVLQ